MKAVVVLAVLLLTGAGQFAAQNGQPRTIHVRKESDLAKAQFDNTRMRLFVIDRFGNVRDNELASYKLWVKTKKKAVSFSGQGNELTPEMVKFLEKQKEAVKIFFTEVVAIDEGAHRVRLPDVIDVWFPNCKPAR